MSCKLNSAKNEVKQNPLLVYRLSYSHRYSNRIASGRIYVYMTNYSDDDDITFLVEFREGDGIVDDFIRVLKNDYSNIANILLDIVEVCLERHYCLTSNV